jgi:magnesium transporter
MIRSSPRTSPLPQDAVLPLLSKEFVVLSQDLTVAQALEKIRADSPKQQILYFYLVDENGALTGVLPTRRLLTGSLESLLGDIAVRKVVALPHTATVEEACDFFVLYRLLALPVVDEERKLLGILSVDLLTEEMLDLDERENIDAVFETIGLRSRNLDDASAWINFRFRFPWLGATLASGILCAVLVGLFEATLAASLILAFFLTLVLGLGESVCVQSLTVAIQILHRNDVSLQIYLRRLRGEIGVSLLLGAACGIVVGIFIMVWKSQPVAAALIGASISFSIMAACVIGLSVPTLFHWLRLDPKVASGPIALALADICTILIYFSMATAVLGSRT